MRDESLHRNFAFTLALPDASRKFDAAQFEKDDFVGIFDGDFQFVSEVQKARDIQPS